MQLIAEILESSVIRFEICQAFGFFGVLQLLDESVQLVAIHHAGNVLGRGVDAVIRHARLRIVVGSDFLGAFASADL